ncbi:MAG: carboxypeptidase-like regulatory domain-containing protein [Dysgonamonadaceae bacterium]|jgi:curved DNA-binding protein CbpA|nr:carboxypeptidase-like regulatory domain-containing protein [Dysgonamonadaceae bacterium]
MKRIFPYLFLTGFLFCVFASKAQNTIQGVVIHKEKQKPLVDAVVIFRYINQDDILAYEMTDERGEFSQNIPNGNDSVKVVVSMLGYKTVSLSVRNKPQQLRFQLEPSEIELKEVTVRAPNLRKQNDTLHYHVAGFKSAQDRAIGDVLKKLPGIEVTQAGSISYNGTPINGFYIEGMDPLGNKYSLAVNNVPVDAVTDIQVIENHQRVRALKDLVLSNQAAINLKLKNNQMIKPIGTVDGAFGWEPLLWNIKLFSMLAAPEKQALLTYKTTNTGQDLTLELTEHPLLMNNGKPPLPADLFSTQSYNELPLTKNRYLFNKTHIVSINSLRKINEYVQMKINTDYSYDERSQDIIKKNEYYFPIEDSLLIIDEINTLNQYNNLANVKLTYTDNAPGYFVENTLKFGGKWTTEASSVTGTNEVRQNYHLPVFHIQNDLNYTKRKGDRAFRFTSFIRYSNQPQNLTVLSDSLMFRNQTAQQDAMQSVFYTDNGTSWNYRFNQKSVVSIDFRLRANLQELDTKMNFIPFTEKDLSNDIRWNQFDYIVSPSYVYNYSSNFRINFKFPFNFVDLYVHDHYLDEKKHFNFSLIDPSLHLNYNFDELWESSLQAGYENEIGDLFDLSRGSTMSNYRHFMAGSGILGKRESQHYSWRLAYRNAITTLFFNFTLSYRPTKRNLLVNRTFINNYSVSVEQNIENQRDIRSARMQIGKYFSDLKTNISVGMNYNQTDFEQKQQHSIIPVTNKILVIDSKIDTKLGDWGGMMYNGYLMNLRSIFSGRNNTPLNQAIQNLAFFVFPNRKWQIKLQGEYLYNDIRSDLSKKLFFCDIGVKYQLKSVEFSFDYTNIFNQKEYSYTSFDGVNTYSTKYNLRPANFLLGMSFKY